MFLCLHRETATQLILSCLRDVLVVTRAKRTQNQKERENVFAFHHCIQDSLPRTPDGE